VHDKTHLFAADSDYCATCGQLIRPQPVYGAKTSVSNRIGLAVSILLHVLGLAYYLLRDEPVRVIPPATPDGAMVYIAPLAPQPAARPQPAQPPKPPQPKPVAKQPPKVAKAAPRAQPSKTRPKKEVPKEEVYVPPVVARIAPPKQDEPQDMQGQIAARRAQRAAAQPQPEPQESDEARGQRIARANIAGAQGGSSGSERNGSGGIFSIVNQNARSAEVKFRGWNSNFKRNWTQQVQVERGLEPDIETAIVKKMIELIRKEKPGDFVWDSHRLGRHVNLSARVADTAELQAFLLKEFFPDYRRR
jgi:type IV secretory pathway VirB10-like protein